MKEKRNWTSKFIFIMLLPLFMAAVVLPAIKTEAAYAGNDGTIGTYNDSTGGESTTGVKISKNGQTVCYALDTWRKSGDGEWKYTGSNIDGSVSEIESFPNSPVYIKGTSGARFGINTGKIKEYMPEKGSVVIKKYVYGKCTYKDTEFTYQDDKSNFVDISESLLKQLKSGVLSLDLASTKYAYNSASYLYDIYDAAVISRNGDIKADIPSDCTILNEGYAYYGIEGEYIIKELPQIEHDLEEGCTFTFKGWYTSPSGGNEVRIGDAIEKGTTIYPQWNKTLNSYNVNCIDILGSNPGGQVLGAKSWTVHYNDEASGSDIGSDNTAGAYYKGFCYTGCTFETVKNDCDVYRYFRPVSYDIIFNGNNAVSGETASLYGCLYGEKYVLTQNGYNRNGSVILDLNAKDAVCDTDSINIPYKFMGWSDTASGMAVYTDCSEVSNLSETDGEKHLYAVWEGINIEISAIPVREGYNFDGWSKEKDSTAGSIYFNTGDINNSTLYAIWKPLKAKYSVAYYIEDNKGGYILDQKEEYEAFTGYEADCSSDLYISGHYSQYILDKDKSTYKGTVMFDGSLLLECYLKKKTDDNANSGSTAGDNIEDSGNIENGTDGDKEGGTTGGNTGNITDSTTGEENTGNSGNTGSGTDGSGSTGSGTDGSTAEDNTENGTNTEDGISGDTASNTSGSSIGGNLNTGNGSNTSGGSIGGTGSSNTSAGSTGNGSNGGSGSSSGSGNSGVNGSSSGSGSSGVSGSSSGSGSSGVSGNGSGSGSSGISSGSTGSGSGGGNSTSGSTGSAGSGISTGTGGSPENINSTGSGSISGGSIEVTEINDDDENNMENTGIDNGGYTDNNGGNDSKTDKKGSSINKNVSYPKPGKEYTKSGIVYKIVKSSSKKRTVKVIKAKKNITKAKIPASVKIEGYKYKVVSIAKKAFIKCNKLKKAVIGKNIKRIGKKAFYKDKSLGNIKIKSKKIKNIGKKAFKKIKPGCTVKIAGKKNYASKVFSMISAKG